MSALSGHLDEIKAGLIQPLIRFSIAKEIPRHKVEAALGFLLGWYTSAHFGMDAARVALPLFPDFIDELLTEYPIGFPG
jgi:hypothetical protein